LKVGLTGPLLSALASSTTVAFEDSFFWVAGLSRSSNPAEKSPPVNLPPSPRTFFLPPKVGLPNADPSPNAALFIGSLLSCLAFFSYWPSSKPYPTKSSFLSFF